MVDVLIEGKKLVVEGSAGDFLDFFSADQVIVVTLARSGL